MMQYKVKKVFQTIMYTTKIASFLSWKQKSQYYTPILAIVCVHFTSNAEIFKMIVDRYYLKYLVQVFCSSCLHILFLEEN